MPYVFWTSVTRFGEALILLPAAMALMLWLALRLRARRIAFAWGVALCAAAAVTAASKVAFMGWGVGIARLNFTGVSGHAMFAAAVIPVLLRAAASGVPDRWHRASVIAGYAIAFVVAVSRVKVGAHSWSEVAAGFALGALASALTLRSGRVPMVDAPRLLLAGTAVWLAAMNIGAPPSPTHGWVTQAALAVSGRAQPYTRDDLLCTRPDGGAGAFPRLSRPDVCG